MTAIKQATHEKRELELAISAMIHTYLDKWPEVELYSSEVHFHPKSGNFKEINLLVMLPK